MSRHAHPFTPEDDKRLIELVERGLGWGSVGTYMSRSANVVALRYAQLRPDEAAQKKQPQRLDPVGSAPRAQVAIVPNGALARRDADLNARIEREERAERTGDYTAVFNGDPLPGRSALDRRRSA